METINYPNIDEVVYKETLDNGLEVFLVEKKDFNKVFALFMTKYGSVDSEFIPIGKDDFKIVPDGIAHFLEHKLFDQEDETDVFEVFSSQSASANAYTSYSKTAYLFSCTDKEKENLKTLLDFVQAPYFTDESVEKEKGIIEQELKMYQDYPSEVIMLGILDNLFHNNPVKIDIGGTVESIYKVDKDLLYECYNTFYHPKNMKLVIVGNFDKDEIIELVKENQSNKDFPELKEVIKREVEEPYTVNRKESIIEFDVSTPTSVIGIKTKDPYVDSNAKIKRQLAISIYLDALLSKSSDYYEELVKEGIINDSFSYNYTEEPSFGFALISCDTNKYEDFNKRVKEILLKKSISNEDFERIRKLKIGEFMNQFDSVDYIARQIVNHIINDFLVFDLKEHLEEFTKEEFDSIIDEFIEEECMSTCTIVKKQTS